MPRDIMQAAIEAVKATIMAIREVDNLISNARLVRMEPRSGGPALKQPIFDWKAANKYLELSNFELEVKNMFMTNSINNRKARGSQ